jgi:hypothetical protein
VPTGRLSFASAEAGAWRGVCRMNSASRGLRPTVGLRRPKGCPASAEADARRGVPLKADFNRRKGLRPAVGLRRPKGGPASAEAGAWRGVCRMNSASRGLRPTVGLRRPKGGPASAEADAWRGAPLKADFNRRKGPPAHGRPSPTERRSCVGGGRRLARSASEGRFQSAQGASGPRSACADREVVLCVGGGRRLARGVPNEFGLKGPSADGRPSPTGRLSFASAEAGARCGVRRMNSASRGLRPTVGLRRPKGCPASAEAGAWRGAPNEFGLKGPSADGRPSPTGRLSFASAEAGAWRGAPLKADFNRRKGLRPAVGLRRPKGGPASAEAGARRGAPLKADFNR